MDDLDDLLRRVQRLAQLEPDRPFTDARLEVADDLEVDVRLEQGETDLVEDLVDVLLAQAASAAETLEDPVEPVGKRFEHAGSEVRGCGPARDAPQLWPLAPEMVRRLSTDGHTRDPGRGALEVGGRSGVRNRAERTTRPSCTSTSG